MHADSNRAVVYRYVTPPGSAPGKRVREYLGLRRWLVGLTQTEGLARARVFANVGHAKNAIPHWNNEPRLEPTFFVQRIRVEVVVTDTAEEVKP